MTAEPATEPAPLRLRHPIHRGSVLASGLAFDLAHTDETTARRRILELSAQLDEVLRAGDVLIALLHTPLRVQSSAAAGAPLVRHGKLWTAAPLAADELAALPAARAAVVLVAGGCARVLFLDELPREQLTSWLDLSMLECRFELESLGDPPAAPKLVLAEVQMEARRSLGVAPLAGEGQGLLRSLLDRSVGPGAPRQHGDDAALPEPRGAFSPLSLLRDALGALGALGALFRRRQAAALPAGPASPSYSSSSRALAAYPSPPPRRSWLRRAFGALGELSARALMRTQLRRLIGRRYARYLERVFEMFDGNQLDEALRHAIPLGGGVEDALRRLSLSLPSPRQSLALRPTPRGGGGRSLDFGAGVYEALKQRYRRAFERLRDQGDFEKAAFVLAELLHADEEAVSFLEQHGKLALAAELAEARGLPAGLVIRQWFLARDRARALRLARRSGAFADAVTRLTSSHPAEAKALRLLWADELASAGAFPAAIDVVWPLEEARALAADWLDRAIAIGGPTSARMLVRKARLWPHAFSEVRDRVLALVGDDELAHSVLEALAAELLAEEPTAELRVLMRVAARRLLHELVAERGREGRGPGGARTSSLARLLELCGDPALRIDAAPILSSRKAAARDAGAFDAEEDTARRPQVALAVRPQPLVLAWARGDRGALPILDALELPDGKLLVALGELGAWLLGRDGRVLSRFSEPAHRLVASDHGDRAIAVAPRGEVMRLARIDLLGKRARHWCDVAIDHFADEYDGATWMVSRRDTVYAIEANAAGWQHAWKVDEPGATVIELRRDPQFLAVWFAKSHMEPRTGDATIPSSEPALLRFSVETTAEVWRYELPSLTLRRRASLPLAGTPITAGAVSPPGGVMAWLSRGDGEHTAEVLVGERWQRLPLRYAPLTAAISRLDTQWLVAAEPLALAEDAVAPDEPGAGVALHLYDLTALGCRAQLLLPGSSRAGVRLQPHRLLAFDELGRLLVLSLHTGEVIRRLCVS